MGARGQVYEKRPSRPLEELLMRDHKYELATFRSYGSVPDYRRLVKAFGLLQFWEQRSYSGGHSSTVVTVVLATGPPSHTFSLRAAYQRTGSADHVHRPALVSPFTLAYHDEYHAAGYPHDETAELVIIHRT
jgi:hypothetical protein